MKIRSNKLGIGILVVGLAMLGFSYYIKNEVAQGKVKISSAENQIKSGKKILGLTPYTSPIGEGISSVANKKIREAKDEVTLWELRARWLLIGGVLCMCAGVGVMILRKKRAE